MSLLSAEPETHAATLRDLDSTRASQVANVPVLHLINGEHYSGAERVQDLLALRLGELGYDVDFACLKPDRFAQMRQARSSRVFELPMRSRLDFKPAVRLAGIIRRGGYRLLHTHTPRAAMVGRFAASLAGVPVVHHLHSPTTSDSTHIWHNYVSAALERLDLPRSARVIAVSHSLGQYARRLALPASSVYVVPNGVPLRGPLADRAAPRGCWTLGTVALFRPRKGLEVLLEALAILRSQKYSLKLRAIGEFETPEYQAKIQRLVDQLSLGDAVQWVGFTRDVPAELARLDVMVLPSLFGEGLPMVVLEAMAAGVPVVATRIEGVPEVIRDGQEGVLAAPGDKEDLAYAIARFIRGEVDWNQIRAAAHQRQAQEFSDGSMARGVAEIYREVLGS